jgi:hypothetical protein
MQPRSLVAPVACDIQEYGYMTDSQVVKLTKALISNLFGPNAHSFYLHGCASSSINLAIYSSIQ